MISSIFNYSTLSTILNYKYYSHSLLVLLITWVKESIYSKRRCKLQFIQRVILIRKQSSYTRLFFILTIFICLFADFSINQSHDEIIGYYNKSISTQMAQVISLADFEAVITKLTSSNSKALVLVTSQKNQDGSYWCPDCQAIKPLYPIFEQESKQANLPYYIFIGGDRPTWKNPENKLRKHPALKITSVPTLGLFDGKKLTRRLVQHQILDQSQRALIYE